MENSWKIRNRVLVDDMRKYTSEYRCSKCNAEYCDHMLASRYKKFKNRIISQMEDLSQISSLK